MRKVVLLKSEAKQTGGLEKYASRIAEMFKDRGDQVTLLNPKVLNCGAWPQYRLLEQYDLAVQKWIERHPSEIVFGMERNRMQTHIRAGNGVHAAYLKTRGLKQWVCHYNPLHRKILEIEKAGFENPMVKKIFTNSYMVQRQILEYYKVDPSKIEVIHNGVEWHELEADFSSWKEVRPRGYYQFLFIGNGYERKGLAPLLEGLSLMKFKEFHLTVIGKEKRIGWYKHRAKTLGLENKVSFLGPLKNVRPYYQMADALVIPSLYDPFANVTLEALAMGVLVISSKQNGGSEILKPENGIIIEEMEEALDQAIRRPKTDASASGIRNSVAHLDFSKQLQKLIDACR